MSQGAEKHTEPAPNSTPHQDVFSSVNEYLTLTAHASPLGSLPTSPRNAIFKNIKVWGTSSDSSSEFLETVTNIFLLPVTLLQKALSHKKVVDKVILHGIDGFVREGETLLVLGRPGSGCTTLFKTLAGSTETFVGWSGDVRYFGADVEEVKKGFRGDVVYNAEGDVHFPTLKVGNTIGFAVQTKTSTEGLKSSARTSKVTSVTEKLLQIFGLENTKATLVGNEFIQGISSGEKKRVSLAETLSTNAKVSLWDNPTQGLDATNSLRFGKALSTWAKTGQKIALAALYQASDDLVNMFDKIILLHDGYQIFFGTVEEARAYLEDLGFVWDDRQSLSEFLIGCTDVEDRFTKEGWKGRVPRTTEDWQKYWRGSVYFGRLQKEIEQELGTQSNGSAKETAMSQVAPQSPPQKQSAYVLTRGVQLTTTLKRSFLRLRGDKPFLVSSIFGPIIISLVVGSAFYNTPNTTNGFFSQQGVIFFSLLFNSVQTLVEISTQFAQRPIVEKQSSFAMYHRGIDAVASLISLYPLKLMGVGLFNIILYFLSGLRREAGPFFIFMLFTYTMVLIMASLFRVVGAVNKHEAIATSLGGVVLLPLIIYTGYIIPKPSMHPWFKWITYINPISYAFESLMANEFHGRSVPCSTPVPRGPAYPNISLQNQVCSVNGAVAGSDFVSGDAYIEASFQYTHAHLWRNYGIMVAYFFGILIIYGLAVEFVPQVVKGKGDVLIFLKKQKTRERQTMRLQEEKQDIATPRSSKSDAGQIATLTRASTKLDIRKEAFTWDKVQYQIPVRGGTKILLTDIHGYVKPGTMTALMGESGAGKTTLLNVLAQRIHTGTVTGSILMHGLPLDHKFARRTGYVESQDVHLHEFTVRETLRFSAQLRQPQSVSDEAKYEYVEEVIEMLDMGTFSDAVVGIPGSGLSLEQRKRMTASVGVELVAKPSMLFLDEPTSGLDSQSSFAIIQCLRKLADAGQAILCTIHQPSGGLFEQFDRLLLLQKGGRSVYFGDIGTNSKDVIGYFEAHGAIKYPARTNPAEYILTATEARDGGDWASIWQNSSEASIVEQEIASLSRGPSEQKPPSTKKDTTSYLYQYLLVQKRSLEWHWRSPVYIRGKLLLNVIAGLFVGFTFYQQKNSAQGLQNKLFATFAVVIQGAPLMNALQPRFFAAKALFESREEPARMYHWSILILTVSITEIIVNLIAGTFFFLPWFFVIGFQNGLYGATGRGVYEWLMLLMFETWISTFGQLIAGIAPTEQSARQLIPMFFVFVVLFCGVLQPYALIPAFWHFVHFASPFTWLIGGLLSNVLHSVQVTCSPHEINILQPPANTTCGTFLAPFLAYGPGTLYNPAAWRDCEYCRYSTGDQYLKTLDITWSGRWRDFGVLWVYALFNLGVLLLVTGLPRWIAKRKRKV